MYLDQEYVNLQNFSFKTKQYLLRENIIILYRILIQFNQGFYKNNHRNLLDSNPVN